MLFKKFQKGINIGGWLSQYEFLVKQPITQENLDFHFQNFITETDIARISDWGFDHIRLPVSGYLIYDPELGTLNNPPLTYIDQCIGWCRKYHLNLILDLHDLWGNVYGAMDKPMPLLTEEKLKSNFLQIWEQLAQRFKHIDDIALMFELLNEVSDATGYIWNVLYKEAISRIRRIDSDRLILVGSNCQNSVSYLDRLDLLDDPNVIYNFHYYDPQVFTHQKAHFSEEFSDFNRTITYPGDISDFVEYLEQHPCYKSKHQLTASETKNDRELMCRLLQNAVNFVNYSNRELYCGEFGVIDSAPPEEAAKWILDFISICDENHIGHALWNYKSLDFGLLDLEGHPVHAQLTETIIHANKKNI